MFRRRSLPIDRDEVNTIFVWLMRLDAKLDTIELLVRGEDPDDE
ncbi:MAG TPA: hypothetical protein VE596_08240 [Gaiellaceae bacterium]|jgi:hypothetical protein|nr:hypothetical protein [Gaiellaceae bacterium]